MQNMTFYYAIGDVFERIASPQASRRPLDGFVQVVTSPKDVRGPQDDIFQLTSHPKLLDLTTDEAAQQLQDLIAEVPLYGFNLELTLDAALTRRAADPRIAAALTFAYQGRPFPNPVDTDGDDGDLPALRHPALGHMDRLALCRIYRLFLTALKPYHLHEFGFEADILGKHSGPFGTRYEGFVTPQGSRIKAGLLLAFGIRRDHDPGKPLEVYMQAGQRRAMKMRLRDPREMLWAWLEADHHQMRRCVDLDRALRIEGLPRQPNWVRYDVFGLLEKEAAKQHLAEQYRHADPEMRLLDKAPGIAAAVRANADGRVDDTLQLLLSESLNVDRTYSGPAQRFAEAASLREREAASLIPRHP